MKDIDFSSMEYLSSKYEMDIREIKPVKNVMRIVTGDGDKCLKKVRYTKGHFLFIISAMKHLLENGFKGILPFIPARNGDLYVELEGGYGFLTDWISSRECDFSNPIDLKMASITLAKLHNASRGFEVLEGMEPRIGWGRWIDRFSEKINDLELFRKILQSKSILSDFDKVYLENLDYCIEQGGSSVGHLKESRYLELSKLEMQNKSFCHHDYAHHNVLISGDLNVYIIDFDYCICDTRLHDLASLIIRNMRHGNWNIEKAQYIVDCYLKEGHIGKDEIEIINGFIEFPQDFWQVGLQYYIEKQKWDENQFNKRLDNFIKDIKDRQQFVNEFMYSIEL